MYTNESKPAKRSVVTVPALRQLKIAGTAIVALTAYDASFARALDTAGIDFILVGDSLGMVIQGESSTLPVTVEHIAYHTACVAKGLHTPLLVADMPFQSDATCELALAAATRFLQAGAAMVKIEGAGIKLPIIEFLSQREIPVCAHLGLTPQSVHRLGGYKVQGREQAAADKLLADALAVEAAGAEALVLECVPSALAAKVSKALAIPTIGIGAGPECDGQILVLHDMLGLNSGHRRPRFVKDFLAEGGSIAGALSAYVQAVRERQFPTAEHGYA